jgi:hypothetical protein
VSMTCNMGMVSLSCSSEILLMLESVVRLLRSDVLMFMSIFMAGPPTISIPARSP